MTLYSVPSMVEIKEIDASFASVLASVHERCFLEKEQWGTASFKQLLELPGITGWLALYLGVPVGLLLISEVASEYEVLTLGVCPKAQNRGIGAALMRIFINRVRDLKGQVFLEVKVTNKVAIDLYSSLGFSEVGRRKRYYPDGSDACVLHLSS